MIMICASSTKGVGNCLENYAENQVLQSGWHLGVDRPRLGAIAQKEAVVTDFLRLGAYIFCCFAFSDSFKGILGFLQPT
jgi:hypothetical protein